MAPKAEDPERRGGSHEAHETTGASSEVTGTTAPSHAPKGPPMQHWIKLKWSQWWLLALLLPASLVVLWIWDLGGHAHAQGAQAQLDLSVQLAQAHQYQECVDAAQRAVKLQPNLAEAYNNIGYCSASMGMWDEGIRDTREALRIKPDLQLAGNNLAWMLREKEKSISGNPMATPPTKADSYLALSLQHAQAHRYQECIDAARQALQLKPDMAEAYNNIGYCSASMGRWDEGIRNTMEALRIKPDFQLADNNLRWMVQEKAKAGGGRPSPNLPSSSK